MYDKAAFVSRGCFVYSVTGETSSSPTPTAPPAGRELICIYMPPQIECLWETLDYGINTFYCITVQLKNNKHNTYYRCTYLYIVNAVIFKRFLTSYLKRDLAPPQKTTITLPL